MEANDGVEDDDDDGMAVNDRSVLTLAPVLTVALVLTVLLWLGKSTLRVSGSDCLTFKVAA